LALWLSFGAATGLSAASADAERGQIYVANRFRGVSGRLTALWLSSGDFASASAGEDNSPDNEVSRRNKPPTSAAEATGAVRALRPKPVGPVPELMIEIV
jgi:hypothetical protein